MKQQIIETFIKLSEGKLTPEEWMIWFSENGEQVEKNCGRNTFLKIKPSQYNSNIRNIYYSQLPVYNWLESQNIDTILSSKYKEDYDREFKAFRNELDKQRKDLRKSVDTKFSYLKEMYPKFFKQLRKSYSEDFLIEKGKNKEEIDKIETELSIKLSADLKTFFSNISYLSFEGIKISFEDLDVQSINDEKYLLLGEFWLHGDGDKLLYNIDEQSILIFAHEYKPPKIIQLSKLMIDFIEKVLVKYLKEYEE